MRRKRVARQFTATHNLFRRIGLLVTRILRHPYHARRINTPKRKTDARQKKNEERAIKTDDAGQYDELCFAHACIDAVAA